MAFLHIQLYTLNFVPTPVNSASVIFTERYLIKALQIFFYFKRF